MATENELLARARPPRLDAICSYAPSKNGGSLNGRCRIDSSASACASLHSARNVVLPELFSPTSRVRGRITASCGDEKQRIPSNCRWTAIPHQFYTPQQ